MPEYLVRNPIERMRQIVISGRRSRKAVRTAASFHCCQESPAIRPARIAAKQMLVTAYGVVETLPERNDFTLADCAAAPALFYADQLVPIEQPRTRAYLDRLLARPSMIRVRREAEPYWHNFPGAKKSTR